MTRRCSRCNRRQWVHPETLRCLYCDGEFLPGPSADDIHLRLMHTHAFGPDNLRAWWSLKGGSAPVDIVDRIPR